MGEPQEPLVSICCITYNHEKYIKDAIESFLMQKTDFPFEIIIHDDASTDMTADIVREYKKKYPQMIKLVIQTENQYSKGIQTLMLVFREAKGEYIALCEGDDYWIDPFKLQKQINEMEKYPACHISFHPAIVKWDDESRKNQTIGFHSKENKVFTIEEVILGGGEFMPTNSIVINKLAIPRIISFFDIAKEAPVGDYYIQILGAENGSALYLSDVMSVYRKGSLGSWSEVFSKSSKYNKLWLNPFIVTINRMDAFTNYKYSNQFRKRIENILLTGLNTTYIDLSIRANLLNDYKEYITLKHKILWHIIFRRPSVLKIWKILKKIGFKNLW